jgi:ParB family transcriptional regulator, chromosome partitioning protein
MPAEQPRRLGRGLEALLAMKGPEPRAAAGTTTDAAATGGLQHVRLSDIRPNPYQPRKEFKLEELSELQASLKASGLLQPITLRPASNGTGFELIAGERRFRAAASLGWTEIPAVVRTIDDKTLLTLTLIENRRQVVRMYIVERKADHSTACVGIHGAEQANAVQSLQRFQQ